MHHPRLLLAGQPGQTDDERTFPRPGESVGDLGGEGVRRPHHSISRPGPHLVGIGLAGGVAKPVDHPLYVLEFHVDHPLGPDLDLRHGLRSSQGEHRQHGLFGGTQHEPFIESVTVLVDAAARTGVDHAHQPVLGSQFVECRVYLTFGEVQHRVTTGRLIRGRHDAVDRHRVHIGGRHLLLDQTPEHPHGAPGKFHSDDRSGLVETGGWRARVGNGRLRRMARINEGRVAIVTGAGRGIGRCHALALAHQGAKVVVNDLGGTIDGTGGGSLTPAQEVVEEIRSLGGEAIANGESVSSFEGAKRMIDAAVDAFGRLDILVNNAGILRDRLLVNMTEAEWDAVIDVHLKGTFAPARHAGAYWREQSKAGNDVDGRIINTSSVSGIYGNVGQTNYGAAKAGIAAFTIIASRELARFGVTVNAVAPIALTRMTEGLGGNVELTDEERDARGPHWVSPIVTWLASPEAKHVTGRVFEASSGILGIAEGWNRGPFVKPTDDFLDPSTLGPLVDELLAKAIPPTPMLGNPS